MNNSRRFICTPQFFSLNLTKYQKPMKAKLVKILKYALKESITEDQLGDQIGFSRQTFYNLRHGTTKPNDNTIKLVDNFIIEKGL